MFNLKDAADNKDFSLIFDHKIFARYIFFFFTFWCEKTCSGNLSKYFTDISWEVSSWEGSGRIWSARQKLLCLSSRIARSQPRGPTGAESKSNLYLWILSRARSLARPPGSRSLLWHPAHTSRIVVHAFVFYFYGRARYDENGEITGVYFCESSWIHLLWPYFVASARLRVRHGNHRVEKRRTRARGIKESKKKRRSSKFERNGVRSLR